MTPSLVLTMPSPTSDTDALDAADCRVHRHVVRPPVDIIAAPPAPGARTCSERPPTSPSTLTSSSPAPLPITPPHPGSESEESEDARDDASMHKTLVMNARPWTGTPIRAIVPLPRRTSYKLGPGRVQQTGGATPHPTCLIQMRPTRFWNDVDTDSGSEIEEDSGDEDGDGGGDRDARDEGRDDDDDDDDDATPSSRRCSYESVTAAQGLSAWSFEELRVECYAQSLVARGTRPPPVTHPSLAIPPAFVPRVVPWS